MGRSCVASYASHSLDYEICKVAVKSQIIVEWLGRSLNQDTTEENIDGSGDLVSLQKWPMKGLSSTQPYICEYSVSHPHTLSISWAVWGLSSAWTHRRMSCATMATCSDSWLHTHDHPMLATAWSQLQLSHIGSRMTLRAAISSMQVEISGKVGNDWQTAYQQAHDHYSLVSQFMTPDWVTNHVMGQVTCHQPFLCLFMFVYICLVTCPILETVYSSHAKGTYFPYGGTSGDNSHPCTISCFMLLIYINYQ